jgi:hypothetical protein
MIDSSPAKRERGRDFGERARARAETEDVEARLRLGRPVQPPTPPTIVRQRDCGTARHHSDLDRVTPTAASATHAASWPHAMKSVARLFA